MLEIYNFFFLFYVGVTIKTLPWVTEESLDFGFLNSIKTVEECVLHCNMAMILWCASE